jgi:hypothetical protein
MVEAIDFEPLRVSTRVPNEHLSSEDDVEVIGECVFGESVNVAEDRKMDARAFELHVVGSLKASYGEQSIDA